MNLINIFTRCSTKSQSVKQEQLSNKETYQKLFLSVNIGYMKKSIVLICMQLVVETKPAT